MSDDFDGGVGFVAPERGSRKVTLPKDISRDLFPDLKPDDIPRYVLRLLAPYVPTQGKCPVCDTPYPRYCSFCGTKIEAEPKFCVYCGGKLNKDGICPKCTKNHDLSTQMPKGKSK